MVTRKRRAGLDTNMVVYEAIKLADEIGYEKLTLAALAGRLGIKTPSLYNHIQGLDDLRKHIAVHGLEQLHNTLSHAVKESAKEERILKVAAAYVAFANENPGVYAATLHAPDKTVARWSELGEQIVVLISKLSEPYAMDDDEVIHWVRGYRSLLHGFVSLQQAGAFGIPLDLNESLRYMLNMYMSGVEKWKAKTD
ncbi:TetR/AcrR family transcriptional regulator [Paenibacillus sp. 1001270B_150601_E10]|uniref:TetR/AcrR family transcriptional regulator n=1 Tax=Paenibacillus sp. 1001270B_150601_E10 TaxID=2787079 RepID=UPI00189CB506|nr:TetR/AcrR family transcriptional regulator [Paenibacillus sp. 1001270B_150601_E10]